MKIYDHINGNTKTIGIIGHPISHTFSPVIQNSIASSFNYNARYMVFDVLPPNLKLAIEGAYALNIEGFNVTLPHKSNVIPYLKDIDSLALQIGAVNTLKRIDGGYKGYNTDIIGLYKSFSVRGIDIDGKSVVIIGAGGAAKAAAILFASKNAKKIIIANRTKNNALLLKKDIEKYYNIDIDIISLSELKNINHTDIAIQCTSLGLKGKDLSSPVYDEAFFKKIDIVNDIIYTPWETEFLKLAKKYDCYCINGFDMLIYQGIAAFEIWFDTEFSNEEKDDIYNTLLEYHKAKEC